MTADITIRDRGITGIIMFRAGEVSHDFFYERSRGTCSATVQVPTPDAWESEMNMSAGLRNEVLTLIAEKIIETENRGCTFTISDYFIDVTAP
jgi:hypothetical protein